MQNSHNSQCASRIVAWWYQILFWFCFQNHNPQLVFSHLWLYYQFYIKYKYRKTDWQIGRLTERQKDRKTEIQKDGNTERQKDGKTKLTFIALTSEARN